MKQSEHKENIRQDLSRLGQLIEKDQVRCVVGKFTILIYLSTQARVLIETKGVVGNHYIVLEETRKSYSETTALELVEIFYGYINKCKAFEGGINVDIEAVATKMEEDGYEHVKGDVGANWTNTIIDALEEVYGIERELYKFLDEKFGYNK